MRNLIQRLRMRAFMAKELVHLARAAWADLRRYARHSYTGFARNRLTVGRLEGRLIATCHVLEKGLSMPESRPRFGAPTVRNLYECLCRYESLGGKYDSVAFKSALAAFDSYLAKHQELGIDIESIITPQMRETIQRWKASCGELDSSVLKFTKASFFSASDAPFAAFCASRHSCRHFDPAHPVDLQKIAEAVRIAIHTPSACNRQPWRVYAITSKPLVERCLSLHTGSRGFQHLIPTLLIVTVRTDVYSGPGEHAQCYVDGGLFAMSLIFALHHVQVGCVALNWSVGPDVDRQLRTSVGIQPSETIIILLGVGHPVEEFYVPRSARRGLDDVLVIVKDT